ITQTGALTQAGGAGAATFNGGAGVITLTQANDFTGAVSLNNSGANNVAVTDANALVLGTSSVGTGTLTVNAVGITQTGALTQAGGAGAATFNGGAGVITLTQANDFTGAVSLNNSGANNVQITDSNALALGTSGVGSGTLTVNAVGITQTGALSQAGGAGAATFNGGAGVITLTQANDFTGAVSLNNSGANNVAVTDTNALVLGASSVGSGMLNITTGGTLSQTGGAVVQAGGAGAVNITATAASTDIQLDTQANNFSGGVSFLTAGGGYHDIGLRNVNGGATLPVLPGGLNNLTIIFNTAAVDLPATTLTGNLVVTAGGAISQSGLLDINGTSSFTAGANAITLTNASNDFTGAVSLNNSGANNVAVTDSNALVLGTSGVGSGTLTVNAVGITQTGALTQAGGAGAATFNGGAGVITLTQANDFTGAVSLNNSGANNVAVTDANALVLGTSSVG
ncbi:beta strand repeat-containing protein, partial [Aquabacterium sp.]|uniref:beta strand repeat-containing protein n=1 Tax=Aquabacterium sp. TaxID=1872578 RepID=UPI003D6D3948